MTTLKWLLSPFAKLAGLALLILAALGTIFAKGRQSGINAERQRSARVVKKVQDKMDKKTDQVWDTEKLNKKLREGDF